MAVTSDMDRSTAFTILLDIDPGFPQLETGQGMERVTAFLKEWGPSDARDMYRFAVDWVRKHPIPEDS